MILRNTSLLGHNTFGIDVNAAFYAEYTTSQELIEILAQLPKKGILHIGGGSNLLFLSDFDGIVLHCNNTDINVVSEDEESITIKVGAGMVWDELVEYCVEHKWYGLENLSLIPGEVGASAVQNIGAYGAEAKDFIVEVECLNLNDLTAKIFSNQECNYAYRQSIFKTTEHRGKWAVQSVTYKLAKRFSPSLSYGGILNELKNKGISQCDITAKQLRETIIGIRKNKLPDPKQFGNAGSFFMNPVVSREKYNELSAKYDNMPHYTISETEEKIPAGWLIEQCGWKGKALGKAGVHDKQALVLINLGNATGKDIVRLSETIIADVKQKFCIDILPEVNFI